MKLKKILKKVGEADLSIGIFLVAPNTGEELYQGTWRGVQYVPERFTGLKVVRVGAGLCHPAGRMVCSPLLNITVSEGTYDTRDNH